MAYWCDDRALLIQQRMLDAAQADALRKRTERQKRERAEAEAATKWNGWPERVSLGRRTQTRR